MDLQKGIMVPYTCILLPIRPFPIFSNTLLFNYFILKPLTCNCTISYGPCLLYTSYFWRTYDQKEIDYIEEKDGKLFAYEFKWKKDKVKIPELFLETYDSEFEVITKDNYFEFLL